MGGSRERKKLMKQFSQNNDDKTRGREEILDELLGQNTLDLK